LESFNDKLEEAKADAREARSTLTSSQVAHTGVLETGVPKYCKTVYFCCVLISQFWNVEISLHFSLAISQFSTIVYQAFDEQTEFSQVLYLIS